MHHQDLNKRILIALIVASILLGGILVFLLCLWICRWKNLKNSKEKSQKNLGIFYSMKFAFAFFSFSCFVFEILTFRSFTLAFCNVI